MADSQVEESAAGSLLRQRHGFLHAQQVADLIEVVRVAVLLADAFLDELVPVVGREHSVVADGNGRL